MQSITSLTNLGYFVIPVHTPIGDRKCSCLNPKCTSIGKHPITSRGVHDASNSLKIVNGWLEKWPDCNVGIATGRISNLVVLDIDPRNGGYESLKQLKSIPKTITVKTGGDGLHFYFRYPETKIPNRVNWFPGIDIRSDGGYVVAPPSKHKSGGRYSWVCADEISDFPEEWIPSIVKKHQAKLKSSKQAILEGERNNFLTSLAGFLSSKGFNSGISLENALQTFNNHHCTPPLESTEVKKISFSINKYSNSWIEPNTFPDITPKAPTMDESYLPESIKPWISDVVERMQVPIEFISIPAIISLSAAIGRSISIFPKKYDNWQVTPNLWGALVARPGFFKSPCIAEATKPLQHLANIEKQNFELQADTLGLEAQFVQAQIDGIMEVIRQRAKADKNDDISSLRSKLADLHEELESKKVVQKRFITNDATVEKLAQLMVDNPQGLLLLRDELFGWLRTFNKAGREGDREFYLESWNGTGSFTIDRISRGTLHVKSMCLSVLGGVQPGKLNSHIRSMKEGGNADDGLMQRFQLIVYPDLPENWENIDREPCEKSWQKTGDLFNHIYKIRQNENVSLRFDDLALKKFVEWRLFLEKRLRSNTIDSPHFESHMAKYRSLIPSLALIFEVANNPQSLNSVSLNSLNLALKWGDFLEQHIKKIYQIDATDEINGAKALAIKILSKKINDKEKIRIIWRRKWNDLNTSDKLDQAFQFLEDLNWVRIETIKTRGRSSSILRLNPNIYQKEYHQNLCQSVGIITSSNRREGPLD